MPREATGVVRACSRRTLRVAHSPARRGALCCVLCMAKIISERIIARICSKSAASRQRWWRHLRQLIGREGTGGERNQARIRQYQLTKWRGRRQPGGGRAGNWKRKNYILLIM